MAYEKRDNSGTLGANKRKEKDDHPSHTGAATINGEDFWISAWVKQNKETGERFFSLSFKPKEERREKAPPAVEDDFDSAIPF